MMRRLPSQSASSDERTPEHEQAVRFAYYAGMAAQILSDGGEINERLRTLKQYGYPVVEVLREIEAHHHRANMEFYAKLSAHETSVGYSIDYERHPPDRYWARCSCGWVSAFTSSSSVAHNSASKHRLVNEQGER